MIKVRHSKAKRALLLDFSEEVNKSDIWRAGEEIDQALRDIGRGYTLIEIFHNHPHFEDGAGCFIGDMIEACYANNRIWRVIRLQENENSDPGLSILHRTRWKREVPEIDMDNIREAIAVAREEAEEQQKWFLGDYSI